MTKLHLNSWEEFEAKIEDLFSQIEQKKQELRSKGDNLSYVPYPLFRGHSNSEWKLLSTLDRIKENASCYEYYLLMQGIQPNIESFIDRQWELPAFSASSMVPTPQEGYAFMVYLRHHGFPSPLLDWTRSYYIAAFFAFLLKDLGNHHNNNDEVAIYAYLEDLGGGKSGWEAAPRIITLGPNVRTHKRHYLQQSEYTICTKKQHEKFLYWNHEDVFDLGRDDQDILWKYTIPASERRKVLRKLDSMNINAYSLFNDEENLLSTLAMRNFL